MYKLWKEHPDRVHLLLFMCALQIMDILTTQSFTSMGGEEANPIMASVISFGWKYVWAAKIGCMILAIPLAIHRRRILICLLYIYTGVIVSNILAIQHLAKSI